MRHTTLALAAAAALLTLTACGDTSTDEAAADTTAEDTTTEGTEHTCEDVPARITDTLADSTKDGVGPMTIHDAAAVRSGDFNEVWMVAARFDITDGKDLIGVWATNSIEPEGARTIYTVDAMSQPLPVWPNGRTDVELSRATDGVEEAIACLD